MTNLPPTLPHSALVDHTPASFNRWGATTLPGLVGIEVLSVEHQRLTARLPIRTEMLNPVGVVHGATPVVLADTLCGYGCIVHLPTGATGFTTIELKSNCLASATTGALRCEARAVHLGRTTQVWDATVTHEGDGRVLTLFRCTQLVLRPPR